MLQGSWQQQKKLMVYFINIFNNEIYNYEYKRNRSKDLAMRKHVEVAVEGVKEENVIKRNRIKQQDTDLS